MIIPTKAKALLYEYSLKISGFLLGRRAACNPLDANHQHGSELMNWAILELLFWFGSIGFTDNQD